MSCIQQQLQGRNIQYIKYNTVKTIENSVDRVQMHLYLVRSNSKDVSIVWLALEVILQNLEWEHIG